MPAKEMTRENNKLCTVRCSLIVVPRGEVGQLNVTSQRVISRGDAMYDGVETSMVASVFYWHPVSYRNKMFRILATTNDTSKCVHGTQKYSIMIIHYHHWPHNVL